MRNTVTLSNGREIPQFGLGVYQVPRGSATEGAVKTALGLGYRHIDTAHIYGNEASVMAGIRAAGVPREEVWITSKLSSYANEYQNPAAMDQMLERLGTDYVDLVLLHEYSPAWKYGWQLLEQALSEGKARSIGVSNFNGKNLSNLMDFATIKPHVLQVERHPYYQQKSLRGYLASYGTVLEDWYPLGHGDRGLLSEPLFAQLGAKYGKSNAQIILRWHIQEGSVVFPSSTNPEHLAQNIDIFGFELADDEMAQIQAMDKNRYLNEYGK
ncbi:aldo/keto reductase [Streptomyces sp. NPDC091217]|uniref:aldo/keto reductase n=1 Tax=Streptomyces sp. NPDC091217 TaxID=3365975 RepID=UPI0037F907E4